MKKSLLIIFLAAGMQQAMAQAPRKVLIEEFTGSWCGYCPMAISYIDEVRTTYPSTVITIAHHVYSTSVDPMTNDFTLALNNAYHINTAPNVMVDRTDWYDLLAHDSSQLIPNYTGHNFIKDDVIKRLNMSSPLSIGIVSSYDSSSRSVNVTVTANFVAAASGDMRINCLLVEDKVTGNSNYDQNNYGGSGCSSPVASSEFYSYPCHIPTSLTGQVFYHKDVVRYNMDSISNIWGTAGVIPSSVSAGQHYSKNYTYTLPPDWNSANMKVVAFVGLYNSGTSLGDEVLNAQQVSLGQITAVQENPSAIDKITLDAAYPNPFNQITNIKVNIPAIQHVSVKVYDLLGHEVAVLTDENLSPGEHIYYWNGNDKEGSALGNGLYLIRLQTENQSLSKTVVLSRN